MGVGQSREDAGHASPEQLSLILAERFATKCFTPLELTHFKDNFFTRATDQDGLKYWNEKTLSDFLGIPDQSDAHCPLDAGPVIFRMVSYLGAFPFQNSLAPSVLTFEAMVKVTVLLTERYGKVLRRGQKNRLRLLFGSLADVGRKEVEKPPESGDEDKVEDAPSSHAPGFDIDAPANDNYDEDEDDDLALAALESLDAIEVFKHDSRIDRRVYEARISVSTFRRLLMLLLVVAPLKPLEDVNIYMADLTEERMKAVREEADSILAAFDQGSSGGISYKTFADTIAASFPYIFDPLTPLFEHLLFSKNLDFARNRGDDTAGTDSASSDSDPVKASPLSRITLPGSFESAILSSSMVSHLSFFLPSTSVDKNLLHGNVRLHPVFSTAAHGSSLTSFSHNVLTWQSGTLLLLDGLDTDTGDSFKIGAYLPQPWKSPTSSYGTSKFSTSVLHSLFQLSPQHVLLPGNPSPSILDAQNTPIAYFSTYHGISIGCQIPPSSRTQKLPPTPHGAGSLTIDTSLEFADFHVSSFGTNGVFLPPYTLSSTSSSSTSASKTRIDIYNLEIWGLVPEPDNSSSHGQGKKSAVELQQAKWDFETREAERRRHVNLNASGGDSGVEQARWLLETAGIIGNDSGAGRTGGST
ncbi:TLD domain-containing protein [Aspergillus puulaauensis]|uniref:Restriction of telomere capping protein 5 n=1 Tax=Aspergillus puulaauensis TaxID=1220207 RepID=A0A7R7XM72_9EURO|nr:restriction of telomere capping protein 5 [Aspergillus puulaauensis]BCS24111.1 restriction of telomere capping protein 5 [Aspergillus puulaauensis]